MASKFSIILSLVTIGSGLWWLIDIVLKKKFIFKDKRLFGAATAESIFPVLTIVLVLRSFLYEPFQIPSGSMMPTLLVGDFILVEKFSYGIKDPIFRKDIIKKDNVKRGDVAVFKYPEDPSLDYVKRIIGMPGDTITYKDKELFITPNCKKQTCPTYKVKQEFKAKGEFSQNETELITYREFLPLNFDHEILINNNRYEPYYQYKETSGDIFSWQVPNDHYFALGDNRDNSTDSRYWGFVPKENLVGKAVAIWMSFEFNRRSDSLLPRWIPTGIRFNRIGAIK